MVCRTSGVGRAERPTLRLFERHPNAGSSDWSESDAVFYTINSFSLQQNLPEAQLILYPDSGHESLFQYPKLFVRHTDMFLRA